MRASGSPVSWRRWHGRAATFRSSWRCCPATNRLNITFFRSRKNTRRRAGTAWLLSRWAEKGVGAFPHHTDVKASRTPCAGIPRPGPPRRGDGPHADGLCGRSPAGTVQAAQSPHGSVQSQVRMAGEGFRSPAVRYCGREIQPSKEPLDIYLESFGHSGFLCWARRSSALRVSTHHRSQELWPHAASPHDVTQRRVQVQCNEAGRRRRAAGVEAANCRNTEKVTRILHCADLHLSVPEKEYSCQSLEIVGIANGKKADVLLFAGDTFDNFPDAEKLRGGGGNEQRPLINAVRALPSWPP